MLDPLDTLAPGSDPIRAGDLPTPDEEDEQATLDFLRGAGHAGLTEVTGMYEMVGSLERQLGAAIANAAKTRAQTDAHEAEQVALIARLQKAIAQMSRLLADAHVSPALSPPDQDCA